MLVGGVLGVLLLSKPVWLFLLSPLQRFGVVQSIVGVCRLCEFTPPPLGDGAALESEALREQALRRISGG